MTARLSKSEREAIGKQLLDRIVPHPTEEFAQLAAAAARQLFDDFFPREQRALMRRMPATWLQVYTAPYVRPTGESGVRQLVLDPPVRAPCTFWESPTEAGQAAIDRWHAARENWRKLRMATYFKIERALAGCRTMEQVLQTIPEAADTLKLPPPAPAETAVADIRAALKAKGKAK